MEHYDRGFHKGVTPQEEESTIRQMNKFTEQYNEGKEEKDRIPQRDPCSHGEAPPKGK